MFPSDFEKSISPRVLLRYLHQQLSQDHLYHRIERLFQLRTTKVFHLDYIGQWLPKSWLAGDHDQVSLS